jgi:hypothetical protein
MVMKKQGHTVRRRSEFQRGTTSHTNAKTDSVANHSQPFSPSHLSETQCRTNFRYKTRRKRKNNSVDRRTDDKPHNLLQATMTNTYGMKETGTAQ